jgi:SPP1 gp7 family putative phage head morphogenesis protein
MDPIRGSYRGRLHVVVERHRRELLRMERAGASEMVRAYGEMWQRLNVEIQRLVQELADLGGQGWTEALFLPRQPGGPAIQRPPGTYSPSIRWQLSRLEALQRQVEAELRQFAAFAESRIVAGQREAVEAASEHLAEILMTSTAPGVHVRWDRLPVEAVSDLVGFTRRGSPLRALLDELGPEASAAVRDGLIQGLAIGQNPREIARRIRKELGGDLTRLLRISRTETLRAYREATRRNYQANDDIIAGWRWLAAKQPRTCAMCLAMDGSFHTNDEELDDHPNGRCAYVPVLRGEEGDGPQWETGAEWLEKSNEDIQRQVLGDAGYEAYKAGAVTLRDYVGQKHDKDWGSTRYARSLKEILGKEGAQRWGQIARWEKLPDEKLIPALVRSEIEPTPHLLERVQGYVAGRGFDPQRMQEAGQEVHSAQIEWQGRIVTRSDRLSVLDAHYLKHVIKRGEWPQGTTLEEYTESIRAVVQDPNSGIMASWLRGRWRLNFMANVPEMRPHWGTDWIVVEYDVARGWWYTAYRAWDDLDHVTKDKRRGGIRWLRPLTNKP